MIRVSFNEFSFMWRGSIEFKDDYLEFFSVSPNDCKTALALKEKFSEVFVYNFSDKFTANFTTWKPMKLEVV